MNIRSLSKEDLQTRVDWMNHPNVYKSMHFDIPILLENTERWFAAIQENMNRSDVVFSHNGGGNICAFGGLTSIDREIGSAELYVFVDPSGQSKGKGTEATLLLCQYGFTTLGLNKIYLKTNEDNLAAQRVYEKVGFKLEGRLREEYKTHSGDLKDRLYYGLLKKEFNYVSDIGV